MAESVCILCCRPLDYRTANPAEPVNGQDERRKSAAVYSPARLCCSVIKRATAQNADALCHYLEGGFSMTEHEKRIAVHGSLLRKILIYGTEWIVLFFYQIFK